MSDERSPVFNSPFGEISLEGARLLTQIAESEAGQALRLVLRAGATRANRVCLDPAATERATLLARGEHLALQVLCEMLFDGDSTIPKLYRAMLLGTGTEAGPDGDETSRRRERRVPVDGDGDPDEADLGG